MRLTINPDDMLNEFKKNLLKNLREGANALEQDIMQYTSKSLPGLEDSPQVYITLKNEVKNLEIMIEANMEFVVDNYGTGSYMSTSNPMYSTYRSSDLWNRVRTDKNIVGRERGIYTDVFGRRRESSGKMAGLNLEGRSIGTNFSGEIIKIEPIYPTNALHKAIAWFYKDWFPQIYRKTLKETNFAKCMKYQ